MREGLIKKQDIIYPVLPSLLFQSSANSLIFLDLSEVMCYDVLDKYKRKGEVIWDCSIFSQGAGNQVFLM